MWTPFFEVCQVDLELKINFDFFLTAEKILKQGLGSLAPLKMAMHGGNMGRKRSSIQNSQGISLGIIKHRANEG